MLPLLMALGAWVPVLPGSYFPEPAARASFPRDMIPCLAWLDVGLPAGAANMVAGNPLVYQLGGQLTQSTWVSSRPGLQKLWLRGEGK